MHTSETIRFIFVLGVVFAVAAQFLNYYGTPKPSRTTFRWWGFALAVLGTVIAAGTAYKAAINWAHLPTSPAGLDEGELWNNRGEPAIAPGPAAGK